MRLRPVRHWLTSILSGVVFLASGAPSPDALAQRRQRIATQPAKASSKPAAKDVSPKAGTSLQDAAERIAARPELRSGRVGIRIENLTTGETLADVDGEKLFQPASNMKLYTTAAALDVLGPDFRVRTSVYAAQPDAQGVVTGDIILYGRGDPNLSDRFNEKKGDRTITPLETLADQVVAAGVKRVTGDLVGDESYFRAAPLGDGWEWNDLQWWYGTEVSALSAADNNLTLTIRPGARAGAPCEISIFPETPLVTISNRTTTGAAKDDPIGIHRGLADNVLDVYGGLPAGSDGLTLSLAVHDPALFTAHLFKRMLQKRGVAIDGGVRREDANSRARKPLDLNQVKEIAGIDSAPLSEMVRTVNKVSQNLHAELLLRHLGKTRAAQDKDADALGAEVVADFLKKAGVDPASLRLRDGSGLSRLDSITPQATVKLLAFMHRHPTSAIYFDSLPVAGVDGTLRGRMKNSRAEKNLRAKTGTLDDVSALSGFVQTADGQTLVFSILLNQLNRARNEGVAAGNALGVAMAEYKSAPTKEAEPPPNQGKKSR
jgi:serine-type D-Ala-D-Ala carboxypeptidase/endopeptidase (penicillin-binding protein 4)